VNRKKSKYCFGANVSSQATINRRSSRRLAESRASGRGWRGMRLILADPPLPEGFPCCPKTALQVVLTDLEVIANLEIEERVQPGSRGLVLFGEPNLIAAQ